MVLDTNVLISAHLLENSVSKKALDLAFRNCSVLYSEETIKEFEFVIQRSKFDRFLTKEIRVEALSLFSKLGISIQIQSSFEVCRDPKDDKFLQLIFDGRADYLITGDLDLLKLNPFQETQILSPSDFLKQSEKWIF